MKFLKAITNKPIEAANYVFPKIEFDFFWCNCNILCDVVVKKLEYKFRFVDTNERNYGNFFYV
jgi:hypothetical protein